MVVHSVGNEVLGGNHEVNSAKPATIFLDDDGAVFVT